MSVNVQYPSSTEDLHIDDSIVFASRWMARQRCSGSLFVSPFHFQYCIHRCFVRKKLKLWTKSANCHCQSNVLRLYCPLHSIQLIIIFISIDQPLQYTIEHSSNTYEDNDHMHIALGIISIKIDNIKQNVRKCIRLEIPYCISIMNEVTSIGSTKKQCLRFHSERYAAMEK